MVEGRVRYADDAQVMLDIKSNFIDLPDETVTQKPTHTEEKIRSAAGGLRWEAKLLGLIGDRAETGLSLTLPSLGQQREATPWSSLTTTHRARTKVRSLRKSVTTLTRRMTSRALSAISFWRVVPNPEGMEAAV